MRYYPIIAAATLAVVAILGVQPANAQLLGGLLGGESSDDNGGGGLLGGDGGLLGGGGADSVVTLSSGSASDSGLVNVGLGSGGDSSSGNILDVNLGGKSSTGTLANVNVGSGGSGGGKGSLLDADVDLLGGGELADIDLDLGGDGLLDIDIDLGLGGNGKDGKDGKDGRNGRNGFSFSGGGGGGGGFGASARCVGADGRQVLQLAARQTVNRSTISSWRRASNVQIVPIRLCPNIRRQVAAALDSSSKVNAIRGAAHSDALINASLSRTNYSARNIFAVQRSGSQLTVYVY